MIFSRQGQLQQCKVDVMLPFLMPLEKHTATFAFLSLTFSHQLLKICQRVLRIIVIFPSHKVQMCFHEKVYIKEQCFFFFFVTI